MIQQRLSSLSDRGEVEEVCRFHFHTIFSTHRSVYVLPGQYETMIPSLT